MSTAITGSGRRILIGGAVASAIALGLVLMAWSTRDVRRVVSLYSDMLTAANRQDLDGVRGVCSARYLKTHEIVAADEGGVAGLPRNIHPNFKTWWQGENIWLCPTNRMGPVYQFVRERDDWRFDGPVGFLRGRNEFYPLEETPLNAAPGGGPALD